ncbi:hypothetical protein H1R20_g12416, partial [Candolleomyces eurysporus]
MDPNQTSETESSTIETFKASNPELIEGTVEGVDILRTEMPHSEDLISQAARTEPDPPVQEVPSNSTLMNPVPTSNTADPSNSTLNPMSTSNTADPSNSTLNSMPTSNTADPSNSTLNPMPTPNTADPSNSTLSPVPTSNTAEPHPDIAISNDSDSDRKNVVFFGETGVGKSSVINMFREGTDPSDSELIPISSGAVGCTFSSKGYRANVNEERYMLWDTAGLNEGIRGTVTHEKSVESLADLLCKLGGKIHLLVYCIRGKRFRQVIQDNYDLFYGEICGSQVPIIAVVTGLENEEPDMENWWTENAWEFEKYQLRFDGHVCITATRGKAMKSGGNSKEGCPVFGIRNGGRNRSMRGRRRRTSHRDTEDDGSFSTATLFGLLHRLANWFDSRNQ